MNVMASMIFLVTLALMLPTVWQQRRAERMAAVRPDRGGIVAGTGARCRRSEQGLKEDAIGFVDSLVIGLASTAPAYSLAAVIGSSS